MIRFGYFSLVFIFLTCFGKVSAQHSFQRLYGGVNQEISLVAMPCPTGGLYYLGATTSTGNGSADPVIMKLDEDGQVIWARAIGGANYDVAGAMTLSADGGLVYAGSTKSYNGNTPDDLYFFKTDSMGAVQWAKTFSTSDLDVASAIIRTADNGFAITGYTRGSGIKRILLIRTDANGDTLFTRTYGGNGDDQGVELLETADGGFVITGKTFTQTLGESDILMMRTDALGNLLWVKSFGGSLWDEGAGIIMLQDGNYLLSGSTISFGQGDFDILLLKTDTAGNILWGKTYGGVETDAGYTARENSDGTIAVSGYSNSMGYGHNLRLARTENTPSKIPPAGNKILNRYADKLQSGDRGDDSTNVFLMKVTVDGDTLWTRTYGDGAQDEAFHFSKMNDGGYLMPGFSTSYTGFTDSTQMLLIRTDSLGHSGCHEQDAHPIIDTTNFTTQTLTFSQTQGINVSVVISTALAWNLNAEDACTYTVIGEKAPDDLLLFPNPASGIITIRMASQILETITVYNALGELVLHDNALNASDTGATGTADFDLSSLDPGIYFIRITASAGALTQKIIIQKN